eukprot:snap_masked-scaffold_16-processed-gene-0.24-mRNA-1 protein AED:1.00 eAED:1.00 QI:0/-1/0/0/-1/1/1/0/307
MKIYLFVSVFFLFQRATASWGDRKHKTFTNCLKQCTSDCRHDPEHNYLGFSLNSPLPELHRLLYPCPEECKYTCMQNSNSELVQTIEGQTKYYGKWPFTRILIFQEFFSVVFSLLNIVPHYRFLKGKTKLRRKFSFFAWVGFVTWMFSAIFHTRDTKFTEKLDYVAAGIYIYVGTGCILTNCFPRREKLLFLFLALCVLLHYGYMLFIHFNYGRNIEILVVVQLIHSLSFFFDVYKNKLPRQVFKLGFLAQFILVGAGLVFELWLDFPPLLGLLDSHAIWHAITPFSTHFWYKYNIERKKHLELKHL